MNILIAILAAVLGAEQTDDIIKATTTIRAANGLTACYVIYGKGDRLAAEASVLAAGGTIINSTKNDIDKVRGMVVEIGLAAIPGLSDDDGIIFIQAAIPALTTTNLFARVTIQVDLAEAAPYNLDGTGIEIVQIESGRSCEFNSRVTREGPSVNTTPHATHVAGILTMNTAGMAQNCRVRSYGHDLAGSPILYNDPGNLVETFGNAIRTFPVVLGNCSFGSNIEQGNHDCDFQGNYGLTSAVLDAIVRGSQGRPITSVWGNGNERAGNICDIEGEGDYYSMAPPACAKNIISVGSVASDDEGMSSFSSWGPCDDGRIKPDIVAPGQKTTAGTGTLSMWTSPCGATATASGTSQSSPTACGGMALIYEQYLLLHTLDPTPATMKAIVIHSAKDLGETGPDYKFGWGLLQVKDALDIVRGAPTDIPVIRGAGGQSIIIVGRIGAGSLSDPFDPNTVNRETTVLAHSVGEKGGAPFTDLRVTLVWSDPPYLGGNPEARALVNDLDLLLRAPDGTIKYPWQLDASNPEVAAVQTAGRDTVNNVEQVVVSSPDLGIWSIQVIATDVPEGPQQYTLIISGGE